MLCFPVFIAHRPCICPAPRPLAVWRLPRLPRLDRGHIRASPDFRTSLPLRVIPLTHRLFLFMRLRTLSFSVSRNPFVCHSYENNRGVAQLFPFWSKALATHLSAMYLSSFFSDYSTLFCTHEKHNPFILKQFRTLCEKHRGVGGSILMSIHRSQRFGRSFGHNHLSDSVSVNSVFSAASVLIPIRCSAPLFHGPRNTPVIAEYPSFGLMIALATSG